MSNVSDMLVSRLTQTATSIAGPLSSIITPVFIDGLVSVLTNAVLGCLGQPSPTPTPTGSAAIAERIKGTTAVERAVMSRQIIRQYVRDNQGKDAGRIAAQTLFATVDNSSQDELVAIIDHVQGVDKSFSGLEMF